MGVELELVYSAEQIAAAVRRLSRDISAAYCGKDICLVIVLKGAFFFAADLARQLPLSVEMEFVRLASYRGATTTGRVEVLLGPASPLGGRHLLVVEDIVDTGLTTRYLLDYLSAQHPASLRLCTLLNKRGRRQVPVAPDFVGLDCEDRFLVGYGLDLDERYRHLPDIHAVIGLDK